MGLPQTFSAFFAVFTTISITCCLMGLYLTFTRPLQKSSTFKISVYISAILYHISRIFAWIFVYYPSMTDPDSYSITWKHLTNITAYIFMGQTYISVICIFSVSSSGKKLIVTPHQTTRYFYVASGFHLFCQLLAGALIDINPLIPDYITIAFFVIFMIGLICTMSMYLLIEM